MYLRSFSPGSPASCHSPGMHGVKFVGDSKLTIGVKVSVDGYLSVLTLQQTDDLSRVYSTSRPMTAGIGSCDPGLDKQKKMDG